MTPSSLDALLERLDMQSMGSPWFGTSIGDDMQKAAAAIRELREEVAGWKVSLAREIDSHEHTETLFVKSQESLKDWMQADTDRCTELFHVRELHGNALMERDALRSENEALRQDAERYRWLRGSPVCWWSESVAARMYQGDALDAAIDAARETKT